MPRRLARLGRLLSPVDACDKAGQTALMLTARGGQLKVVKVLASVSDIEARGRAGKAAADTARDHGHADVACLIDSVALAAATPVPAAPRGARAISL